jgi:hypothetical protein
MGVRCARPRPPRACSCGANGHQLDRTARQRHFLATRGWPPVAASLALPGRYISHPQKTMECRAINATGLGREGLLLFIERRERDPAA